MAEKGDIGWRVMAAGAAFAGGFVARKAISFAWKKATGKEPPLALASARPAAMAADANPRLRELIENDLNSFVAGERLNVVLLRRFYARHGFAPVWTTRQSQADSLMKAV